MIQTSVPETRVFVDKTGNPWACVITVGTLKRVLEKTQIDLTKLFEDDKAEAVRALLVNPFAIADVLFAVCEPTANERKLDSVAFGELLEGDVLGAASDALFEGLRVFFSGQDAGMGESLGTMVRGFIAGRSRIWNRTLEAVQALDMEAEADKAFEKELAKRRASLTSGSKSTDSPADSASQTSTT